MNRKQLGVTSILICLMMVMVVGEKFFNGKIKDVALTSNNIESMLTYKALDGQITYELPDNWTCKEISYPGEYIAYNNKFYGEEMGINGNVQIIKTSSPMEEIVDSDINILKEENIKDVKSFDDKIGDKIVKKVVYEEKTSIGRVYETKTYYAKLNEEKAILKVSFSSGKDKYKENYEMIYRIVLDSFQRRA